jgi:hypothetical protein
LRLELLSKIYYFILELVVPMDIPIVVWLRRSGRSEYTIAQ